MKKTRNDILQTLRQAQNSLMQRWPISHMFLFGSVARGEQTDKSDVDIIVELNGPIGWHFVSLADELEALLEEKVDLVSKRGIKPRLWPYIVKDIVDVF